MNYGYDKFKVSGSDKSGTDNPCPDYLKTLSSWSVLGLTLRKTWRLSFSWGTGSIVNSALLMSDRMLRLEKIKKKIVGSGVAECMVMGSNLGPAGTLDPSVDAIKRDGKLKNITKTIHVKRFASGTRNTGSGTAVHWILKTCFLLLA
jgi:hypothetical protein